MSDTATPIELLFTKAGDYSRTTIELFKLNAIDKSADVVSSLAVRFVIFMVVALVALIVNIGVSLWLGTLFGKSYYGFFCVAGFYVLVGILLYIFRNQWIKEPISNSMITQMLKRQSN